MSACAAVACRKPHLCSIFFLHVSLHVRFSDWIASFTCQASISQACMGPMVCMSNLPKQNAAARNAPDSSKLRARSSHSESEDATPKPIGSVVSSTVVQCISCIRSKNSNVGALFWSPSSNTITRHLQAHVTYIQIVTAPVPSSGERCIEVFELTEQSQVLVWLKF